MLSCQDFPSSDIQPEKVIYHHTLLHPPLQQTGVTYREGLLLVTLTGRRCGRGAGIKSRRHQVKQACYYQIIPFLREMRVVALEDDRQDMHPFSPDSSASSFQHKAFPECNYFWLWSVILIKRPSYATVLDVIQHFHLFCIFKADHIMKRLIKALVLINQSFCHVLSSEPDLLIRVLFLVNSWLRFKRHKQSTLELLHCFDGIREYLGNVSTIYAHQLTQLTLLHLPNT